MRQLEVWVFTVVICLSLVWGIKALHDLNDGRVQTVVKQLVK